MKITYKFDPVTDREELEIFQKSIAMYGALADISEHLRGKYRYPAEGSLEQEGKMDLEEFRSYFIDLLENYKIEL